MAENFRRLRLAQIAEVFEASAASKGETLAVAGEAIADAGEVLIEAFETGHKLLCFGNGGSASDAQHLAAELAGRFDRERPGLPALALTANTSDLTAIGNDYGFDRVFSRLIEAHGQPGDVAFLNTSGHL